MTRSSRPRKGFRVRFELDDEGPSHSSEPRQSHQKRRQRRQNRPSRRARWEFEAEKHVMADKFVTELDRVVANGQITALTKDTGGVRIVWNSNLKSVAGTASSWRAKTPNTDSSTKAWYARIELAPTIIDDDDKLLNVVAHEFCHLLNKMISNVYNRPHGKSFKEWGAKVSSAFAHKNIHVTRCHSYHIDYKYIWTCKDCGRRVKRHFKRAKHIPRICHRCNGELVQTKPMPEPILID